MSRCYGMRIVIYEARDDKTDDIKAAVLDEWPFEDWFDSEDMDDRKYISAYGEACLCGGESEEEFADRVAKSVWLANETYCEIEVNAVYLEELPFECHVRDEDYYKILMADVKSTQDVEGP